MSDTVFRYQGRDPEEMTKKELIEALKNVGELYTATLRQLDFARRLIVARIKP